MKHFRVVFFIVGLLFFLSGCKQNIENHSKISGGIFSIKKFESTKIANSRAVVSLGNISVDSTVSLQFLLTNIGDFPIKNVSMSPSAEGISLGVDDFSINPISIDEISPSSNSSFGYVVTVYLNHGLVYGKIGTYNLLSGLTKLSIKIMGYTTLDGTNYTEPTSLDAELNTSINIADWKLEVSDDGIAWIDARGGNQNSSQFMWYNPLDGLIDHNSNASYYRIVNTGNVPIGIMEGLSTTTTNDYANPSNFTNIPAGSSLNINRHDGGAGFFFYGIYTYGTMYNFTRNHEVPGLASTFWSYSALQEGYLPISN